VKAFKEINMPLTTKQQHRFSRQILLPEIGAQGQKKIQGAKVLIVGCGALGGAASLYLAGAGVGSLGLVDPTNIQEAHLPRQPFFTEEEVGEPKVQVLAERIKGLYSGCSVKTYAKKIDLKNAAELIKPYDIVVDATDNFPSRYLINDACVAYGKPFVSMAVYQWEGLVSLFDARKGPCYRCLYPEAPREGTIEGCDEGGVLGTLPGILSAVAATEVIKHVVGQGINLQGRLMLLNTIDMMFSDVHLVKNPACPVCSKDVRNSAPNALVQEFESLSAEELAEMTKAFFVSAKDLQSELKSKAPIVIVDVRDSNELEVAKFPNAKHVPLGEIESFAKHVLPDLRAREVILVCHNGMKSLRALGLFNKHGVGQVRVLFGGIDRWAREVDSTIARY